MLKIHFVSLVLKCCNNSLELTGENYLLGSQFCMLNSSNTLDFSANLHSFKADSASLESRGEEACRVDFEEGNEEEDPV